MDAVVEVETRRFGRTETVLVPERNLFTFPRGIPGFQDTTAFALIDDGRYQPLYWLQSLDEPEVSFVLLDPSLVVADYEIQLSDDDITLLDLAPDERAQVLCILVVPGGAAPITANLRAPLTLNRERRRGTQIILSDDRYPLRHPVDLHRGPCGGDGHLGC